MSRSAKTSSFQIREKRARVEDGPLHEAKRHRRLLLRRARPLVELQGVGREVADEDVEELVERVVREGVVLRPLEDEVGVDGEGEEVAHGEDEVDVLRLLLGRRGGRDELAEGAELLAEEGDVRDARVLLERRGEVVEADLPEAARRPLREEEGVVRGLGPAAPPPGRRRAGRASSRGTSR